MRINDLYKASDKSNHQRWIIVGLAILALISLVMICEFGSQEPTPEEVENMIKRSEQLTLVDKLCNDLPKPDGFQFVYKNIKGNSFTANVNYLYKTDLSKKEIQTFYQKWFDKNGWVQDKDETFYFNKENLTIGLASIALPEANYSIYCAERIE